MPILFLEKNSHKLETHWWSCMLVEVFLTFAKREYFNKFGYN